MNKFVLFILAFILLGCGGTLTEEQRKKMHEAAEQQAIIKVSEAEILDAAFQKGRSVIKNLSQKTMDSMARAENVKIVWLQAGATNATAVEQQLIDAYINSVLTGASLNDNVQNVGQDSVLYTNAVVFTHPDSTIEVKGTWNIWMTKKQLVLGMNKH